MYDPRGKGTGAEAAPGVTWWAISFVVQADTF